MSHHSQSILPSACPPKPTLGERPLIVRKQADALTRVFKVLANDTRLRLLHALVRMGEASVTDLAASVGMRPQAVSNQLQRLVDQRILGARRDGTKVYYHLIDRCVLSLLHYGWCITEEAPRRRRGD